MLSDRRLWHIYAILLIDVVVANLLGPLLNEYISDLPGKPIWLTGGTAVMLGVQLAMAPTMGKYADHNGRKRAIVFSTCGSFLTTLLLLPVQAWGYLINRVAKGATNGMYSVLRSSITDIATEKNLLSTTSLYSFIVGFGTIIGPMFGGLLLLVMPQAQKSPIPLVIMALVLAAVNIVLAIRFKETNEKREGVDPKELKDKAINALKVKALWDQMNEASEKIQGLKPIFLLNLVATLGVGYYPFFLAFITQGEQKMDPLHASYFFMFFGALAGLSNFIFFRYFVNRVNIPKAILFCALLGTVVTVLYSFSESSPVMLYAVAGVDAVAVTLLGGLTGGLLSKLGAQSEGQGEMFGGFQALGGVASFVTAVVNSALSGVSMKAPFIWCAVCLAVLAVQTIRLPDEARKVGKPLES